MLQFAFSKLQPVDQVKLGLCSQHAKSNFWKCLCSRLWYCSTKSGRKIRKLRINLSSLASCSDTALLEHLSHLHVSNTDGSEIESIVLPKNLTYCFLEHSQAFRRCALPDSLQFFETNETFVQFMGLDDHPNLTVLRMPHFDDDEVNLPPNLTDLEFDTSFKTNLMFPHSLTKLSLGSSDLTQIPASVFNLNIGTLMQDEISGRIYPNVHCLHFNSDAENLVPSMFPNVYLGSKTVSENLKLASERCD